jgi:YD repeat-containing protein
MPDGDLTTYAWDADGRLQRMTDPEGGQYRFSYDSAGRRIGQTYPNGMTLTQ